MFQKQVQHYKDKFYATKKTIRTEQITRYAKSMGLADLSVDLKANSLPFQNLCLNVAKTLMPGRVSCTTYAAVVACAADMLGIEYKVYSGFCMPKSAPNYDKNLSEYHKRKDAGVEHPVPATHLYVQIEGVCYEIYNGETNGIEHIDVVEV